MLMISWNMGCGPNSRYRRSHEDAWHYLLQLGPDVVLVQEALLKSAPSDDLGTTFWSADLGTDSGTAVFVRGGVVAQPVELRSPGSYAAAVTIRCSGVSMLIASVHVGPGDYREHRRVLTEKLTELTAGRRFVVGGDLNAARHWDEVYGGRSHTSFFKTLADRGFHDCHWTLHGKEVQSFWGHQAREAYQCDHFFSDSKTAELGQVRDCVVVDNPQVRALSDHGPLRLDLAIELEATGS